ncbi:MAG: efflux RND transporter periplasmic adaptor subunit [Fimbriimonadales bacterium]
MSVLRILLVTLSFIPAVCFAGVDVQAGPYRVSLTTQPRVIPVGQAKVVLKITDASGKPLEDLEVRAIAGMPGMNMGEREQRAGPVSGEPGGYAMQAAFPMGGGYNVTVKITGAPGAATAVIPVKTGQDTGEAAGGFSLMSLVPWAIGLALLVFVIVRMRATGQRANWRAVFNRGTIGGVLLLAALFAIAVYAVNNMRREGSMTPIEAQVMEMNTPAPPGTTAVQLATVRRGPISETVRYTGQAVGFVEQDVNPRGTGVIVWMPYYVGDKVKKGQVLARLDTSQLDPQLAEKAAMTNMAAQGVGVAATEYQTALQEVAEARAGLSVKQSMVDEAQAMLEAARQEKEAIDADVGAAAAEASFRNDELRRMRELFEKKAVSRSELQQAESEAADARGKVNAALANVRKAGAMISAAQKKVRQAQAEVRAAEAGIRAKQSAANAAKQNIAKERAGVAQARAGYESAAAQKGYAALKAEVDGVITQRTIGPGTLVNPGQTVLKVAQISPIRLQANVAASDLERIGVGSWVSIVSRDSKAVPIRARISSISPAVDPQSRTGVVEVVWPNANGRFLPGQFVTMEIEVGGSRDTLFVPVEAIQRPPAAPGEPKAFVWMAEPGSDSGRFTVKRVDVRTGASDGKSVAILSGLAEGQQVVTTGAAYLREGGEVSAPVAETETKGPVVEITAAGYRPDSITVEAGEPVTITFIRRTDQTCGTEIVFPDLKITKPLPLNKPVEVTLTPEKAGELRFTCGMDMLRGKVVVR